MSRNDPWLCWEARSRIISFLCGIFAAKEAPLIFLPGSDIEIGIEDPSYSKIKRPCLQTSPNIFIISQNRAFVNTAWKDRWNFSQINKKYLWTFDKMSIENHQNICYNKITKKQEVQTNENLNQQAFIKVFSDICIEQNKKPNQKWSPRRCNALYRSKQTETYRSRIKRARKIFLKSIHPSPFVTENFNKTKSGVLIRE